jgi:hypothetical protein
MRSPQPEPGWVRGHGGAFNASKAIQKALGKSGRADEHFGIATANRQEAPRS